MTEPLLGLPVIESDDLPQGEIVFGDMSRYIKLKRRSWFGRLLQLPKVFYNHYLILRTANGRLKSARAAWKSARLLITPVKNYLPKADK